MSRINFKCILEISVFVGHKQWYSVHFDQHFYKSSHWKQTGNPNVCSFSCIQCQIIYPRQQLFTMYELETMGFVRSEVSEHSLKLRNIAVWVPNPVSVKVIKSPALLVMTFTETARGSCFASLLQKKQRPEWKSAQEITLSRSCPLCTGKDLISGFAESEMAWILF